MSHLLRLLWILLVSSSSVLWAAPSVEPRMAAHCINVGQADATLLEFPCGAVLIDAGAQDDQAANHLIQFLRTFFNRRSDLSNTLAAVYITHPHKDHTEALRRVLQFFPTKRFIENGQDYGSGIEPVRWVRSVAAQRQITLRNVLNRDFMHSGNRSGLTDEVIDPLRCEQCDPEIVILSGQWERNPGWPNDEFRNNNNHSLVIRVGFGESSFLFPGDLEEPAIHSLLEYYQEDGHASPLLDVGVYHVGHHGSHNATDQAWLDAMTPTIAVISMGRWDFGKGTQHPFTTWAYGHPRRLTVDLLARNIPGQRSTPIRANLATGAKRFFPVTVRKRIYATGWDGDTTIRASLHNEFVVSTSPGP
jgi:competence protein ComEC